MNRLIVGLAIASLAACGEKPATQAEAPEITSEPELRSGLLLDYMDKGVRPGNDFNAFVNGSWIKNTEIPADKPGYGIFTILRDESQEHVKAIIEESADGDFAKGSDEQKVGDLFASYMDMETRNGLGIAPIQAELDQIDGLKDHKDLAHYFAKVNKLGVSVPFVLDQYVDFKDPDTYMIYTFQGGLGSTGS